MERFKEDEVGLSHPYLPLSIKLGDDGFVHVQAGAAAGISIDSKSGAVTIYGSSINLVAADLRVDGYPVNKESIISRTIGKIRNIFSQATPKFPKPEE